MIDLSKHPCFDSEARRQFGRIHLPVAPACNVQCNFCDRKYACTNESRPGVTASILSPEDALKYFKKAISERDDISVVGIAGPGDPFANTSVAMKTLSLIRHEYPEMILCVATNGLGLLENIQELWELDVSHVTVTVNAVQTNIIEKIYAWIKYEGQIIVGKEMALVLYERQKAAIKALVDAGIIVKINTVIIPGINDSHIDKVSDTVAGWGADIQNCIPLLPVYGTPFGLLQQPEPSLIHEIRRKAEKYIPQMAHCNRCRSDACGLLTEKGLSKKENITEIVASEELAI